MWGARRVGRKTKVVSNPQCRKVIKTAAREIKVHLSIPPRVGHLN